MSSLLQPTPKRNLSEHSPANSFVQRVTRQYIDPKGNTKNYLNLNLQSKLGNISPFLQKKIDALSTSRNNRTVMTPTPKNRCVLKPRPVSPAEIRLFSSLFKVILTRRYSYSFKQLSLYCSASQSSSTNIADLLQMTLCNFCNRAGLTLLTTSTQGELSPRFLSHMKQLLPKKAPGLSSTQPFTLFNGVNTSAANTEPHARKKSICYQENESPEPNDFKRDHFAHTSKIYDLPDISNIPITEVSYADSPPLTSARRLPKTLQDLPLTRFRQQISFETSYECRELPKDYERLLALSESSEEELVQIPKLNLAELRPSHIGLKGSIEVLTGSPVLSSEAMFSRAFTKIAKLILPHMNATFSEICSGEPEVKQSLNFEFSREELSGTFGVTEFNLTPVQRTAYRILQSRLQKFLFRRKMHAFYSLWSCF